MSLPVGLQTVTVTGEYLHPDGTPFQGRVVFTPEPATITSSEYGVIVLGEAVATPGADGQLRPVAADGTGDPGIVLLATDADGCTPTGWTYRVREQWYDAPRRDYPASLPAATPVVKLAAIAPTDPAAGEYVVVTGPAGPTGATGPKGDKGDPGSGGAVDSVNGQTGVVDLHAGDVNADAAGSAAAAQAAAISTAAADATTKANGAQSAAVSTASADATTKASSAQAAATSAAATDATGKVVAHTSATDPHGDRAAASAALAAHEADTTAVHGIADTAALETQAGATAKVTAHTAASDPHRDRADAASRFVPLTDGRLTDARTPTPHASTHATAGTDPVTPVAIGAYTAAAGADLADRVVAVEITETTLNGYVTDALNRVQALENTALTKADNLASLNSAATARASLGLGGAATLNVGTGAGTVAAGNDSRFTDSHTPTGAASGDLSGTYPGPTLSGTANVNSIVRASRLDQMAAPTAAVGLNSQKITSLANGTAAQDAAAFGQIPVPGTGATNYAAGNDTRITGALPTAGGTMTGTTNATLTAGTTVAEASLASGDTFDRFRRDTSGREERGSGAAARDTFWYRSGVGVMATDGLISAGGGDPTADNHLTRRAWVEEQNGWGLGDYIAAGSAIKAWTGSPGYTSSGAFTFGQTKLNKVWLRTAATLTTVTIFVSTAGVGLTSGQNLVAILDASGNLVAISGDQTSAWASTGTKPATMTTPYAAAAGGYYVAVLCNGTTSAISVTMHTNSGTSLLNFGLTTANGRCLQTATGQTTIASMTLSSQTLSSSNFAAVIT